MSVLRVEHKKDYTVLSNRCLRDKRLSLKAKGLLSLMLSLPEQWRYSLEGLASICREGRDAIRSAVQELENAGYLRRVRTFDKDGRLTGSEYIIREWPVNQEEKAASEAPVFSAPPSSDNPTEEVPALENTTQLNKDKKNKDGSIKDSFPSSPPGEGKKRREKKRRVYQEDIDEYRETVRENIEYETLIRDRSLDAKELDNLVELMVETLASRKQSIRVAGNDFPKREVEDRLLQLDREHIRFVFDCLRKNTTRIRNMKQYLLTVLFNAPVTIEHYYDALVRHDFASGAF